MAKYWTFTGHCLLTIVLKHVQPTYGVQVWEFGNMYVRSNGSTLHGRIATRHEMLTSALCGADCSRQRGCIGFVMVSSLCSLILIYPGPQPDANGTLSEGASKIWWKRYVPYPRSCLDAKYWYETAINGKYWIVIPGTYEPVEVYCDMTTASGGWTLVWSYGFTDYGYFNNVSNAVEPIPSRGWMPQSYGNTTNIQSSKTIPKDPQTHGAMEFELWVHIGNNFLVRSNINNEIMCTPVTGSIVNATVGSVSCSLVADIVQKENCTDVPDYYDFTQYGPFLKKYRFMYYWNANKDVNWPTHDPCAQNGANHKLGVSNPGGQLYLMDYPTSCEHVKTEYLWVTSGQYWIMIPGTYEPVKVYCDMETD